MDLNHPICSGHYSSHSWYQSVRLRVIALNQKSTLGEKLYQRKLINGLGWSATYQVPNTWQLYSKCKRIGLVLQVRCVEIMACQASPRYLKLNVVAQIWNVKWIQRSKAIQGVLQCACFGTRMFSQPASHRHLLPVHLTAREPLKRQVEGQFSTWLFIHSFIHSFSRG